MSHDAKLQRALDWLRGHTSPPRSESRYCLDRPVRKGAFDVPISSADMRVLVSTFFGKRLG